MATDAEIISLVRRELGDLPQPFRSNWRGTGDQVEYDLSVSRVSLNGLSVFTIDNETGDITDLVLNTDFTVDTDNGVITLADPLPLDDKLVAQGVAFGMFTDEELTAYVHHAVVLHVGGDRYESERYMSAEGFIRYERTKVTLANLPPEEDLLVAIMATIEVLWALATDAATDIDITTSEGTHINRGQRFAQLHAQIGLLEEKYRNLSALMGVGLYAVEVYDLRRVSRTTGRLVPIFVDREYDDHKPPARILPKINMDDADPDGPPSPAFGVGLY